MCFILYAFLYLIGSDTLVYLPSLLPQRQGDWRTDVQEAWESFDWHLTPEENLCCELFIFSGHSQSQSVSLFVGHSRSQ